MLIVLKLIQSSKLNIEAGLFPVYESNRECHQSRFRWSSERFRSKSNDGYVGNAKWLRKCESNTVRANGEDGV